MKWTNREISKWRDPYPIRIANVTIMATPFNQIGHDQLESGWFLRIIDVCNLYISHEMDHDS